MTRKKRSSLTYGEITDTILGNAIKARTCRKLARHLSTAKRFKRSCYSSGIAVACAFLLETAEQLEADGVALAEASGLFKPPLLRTGRDSA